MLWDKILPMALAALAATSLTLLFFLSVRYFFSTPKVWRDRVLQGLTAARQAMVAERNELESLAERRRAEEKSLADHCVPEVLAAQLDVLAAKYEALEWRARARLKAAQVVYQKLQSNAAVARRVTFWRYLAQGPDALVPAALLQAALPDVQAVIRAADDKARKAHEQQSSGEIELPPALTSPGQAKQ